MGNYIQNLFNFSKPQNTGFPLKTYQQQKNSGTGLTQTKHQTKQQANSKDKSKEKDKNAKTSTTSTISTTSTGDIDLSNSFSVSSGSSFEYTGETFHDEHGDYTDESIMGGIVHMVQASMAQGGGLTGGFSGIDVSAWNGVMPSYKGFDVEAACKYIATHCANTSQHICATRVREALEAGGINTAGHPVNAWQYVNFLGKVGFRNIGNVNNKEANEFKATPGDIACYQKYGNPSVPGHICMYTPAGWISDFKQNRCSVYNAQETGPIHIFRYSG